MYEMTVMKGIEMFAEAIPGVIIQLMALTTNKGTTSRAAWLSLSVSALTTGFASATISYDFDTDPVKREQVPDFYGLLCVLFCDGFSFRRSGFHQKKADPRIFDTRRGCR